jgi:hypothetical protein
VRIKILAPIILAAMAANAQALEDLIVVLALHHLPEQHVKAKIHAEITHVFI